MWFAENGGHGLAKFSKTQVLRTPQDMKIFAQPERKDSVTFESYDDTNYGYLRVTADATQLAHRVSSGVGWLADQNPR